MYISKIEMNNIKCFNHIAIDLIATDSSFRGCVILGDNGVGKTTILQGIAMSLAGRASASGLLDELEYGWIKKGTTRGSIRLELKSDNNKSSYSITTKFGKENGEADIVTEQETKPHDFPWNELFICGYGVSRGVIGDTQYSKYSVTDAVYTLFAYETGYLQNPELSIRRIKDAYDSKSGDLLNKILNRIATILMLNEGAIQLSKGGLSVSGSWGEHMPLGSLADGHQAMITLITDLLGWALLHHEIIFEKELSGIVIIDEIEQHLHPKWQRKIVTLLKKVFPNIQFIMTTNSPLIAGNAGELFGDVYKSKLFFLSRHEQDVQISEIKENLGELDCDQILSSEAFGHIYNINPKIENVLREASLLAANDNRTSEEDTNYQEIKKKLKTLMFPEGKTLIERVVEREYYEELAKQIEEFNKFLNIKSEKSD